MNFNLALKINSIVMLLIGMATIPSIAIALIDKDKGCQFGLLVVFGVCAVLGIIFTKLSKGKKLNVHPGDAYVMTLFCWVLACIIGAFPFYLSGNEYTFVDSLFESVTGFTTTGCSAIPIESLPDALILWKATSHWLGGMGILILMVSIFAFLGISGLNMASTESPGQGMYKNKANIKETSRFLFKVYSLFSIVEFLLLLPSGMSPFDAVINTMSCVSTGGLLIREAAIPFFQMGYVKIIISIFSILASASFMLYFFIAKKDFKALKENFEIRIFFIIMFVSTGIIVASLMISGQYTSFGDALEDGAYEAIAATSTSGYTACSYDKWPIIAQTVLILQIVIGGCAGSTAGSIKVVRFAVICKLIKRGLYKFIHPQAVKPVRVSGQILSTERVSEVTLFTFLYFLVFGIGCLVLSLDNQSMFTTISSVASMMSNAGMNFGQVGLVGDYSFYSPFAKIVLCILSIAGRLEIYSVVFIFSKSFWKKDHANF